MPSHISWIDFSTKDRDQMLNVVHLFDEKDTRDELGIGSVRDAISDFFFPGTSTIQTRARYFLFVPWTYRKLEEKRVASSKIEERARKEETYLVRILKNKGENNGLIGVLAGDSLKRLPSNIYWNGLGVWGIRLFPGNQYEYHRSLDSYYRRVKNILKPDGEDSLLENSPQNWHPGLPEVPNKFPDLIESFELTAEEAEYLRDRILTLHGQSLLAQIIRSGNVVEGKFVWEHPDVQYLSTELQEYIGMARSFSELMNGAALLYNLLLAEISGNDQNIDKYIDAIEKWGQLISERFDEIEKWAFHLNGFWNSPLCVHAHIPKRTMDFVKNWADITILQNGYKYIHRNNSHGRRARDIIRARERKLKGPKSRIDNPRALELWSGAAGTGMLDYRWGNVRVIVNDIIRGLDGR